MTNCVLCGEPGTHVHVTTETYSGPVHRDCWTGKYAKDAGKKGRKAMKAKRNPVTAAPTKAAAKKDEEPQAPVVEKKKRKRKSRAKAKPADVVQEKPSDQTEATAGDILATVDKPAVAIMPPTEEVEPPTPTLPPVKENVVVVPCPPGSTEVIVPVPDFIYDTIPHQITIRVAVDWGPGPGDAIGAPSVDEEEDFIPEDALELK